MEQLKNINAFLKGDVLHIRNPLTAVEKSLAQAEIIKREAPVYFQAMSNYLKNRAERITEASKTFTEVI